MMSCGTMVPQLNYLFLYIFFVLTITCYNIY